MVAQNYFVSVIIPVYNGAEFLREAIDSVLSQLHPSLEIIAVDDGSTDASRQILASYGGRLVAVHQPNSGVASARNAGIRHARGELIAFLDQDDWWLPDKLRKQVEVFRPDEQVGLVHCEVEHYDHVQSKYVSRFNPNRSDLLVGDCYRRLLMGNAIFNSSVIVRRTVLDGAGFFNTAICGNNVQDYDLWLRCAKQTRFAYLPEKLAVYRLHPGQGMWNVTESHYQLVQLLERHVGTAENVTWQEVRTHFADLFCDLGIEYLDGHNRALARSCFARAMSLRGSRRELAMYAACFLPNRFIDGIRRARCIARKLCGTELVSNVPAWTGRLNNGVS